MQINFKPKEGFQHSNCYHILPCFAGSSWTLNILHPPFLILYSRGLKQAVLLSGSTLLFQLQCLLNSSRSQKFSQTDVVTCKWEKMYSMNTNLSPKAIHKMQIVRSRILCAVKLILWFCSCFGLVKEVLVKNCYLFCYGLKIGKRSWLCTEDLHTSHSCQMWFCCLCIGSRFSIQEQSCPDRLVSPSRKFLLEGCSREAQILVSEEKTHNIARRD